MKQIILHLLFATVVSVSVTRLGFANEAGVPNYVLDYIAGRCQWSDFDYAFVEDGSQKVWDGERADHGDLATYYQVSYRVGKTVSVEVEPGSMDDVVRRDLVTITVREPQDENLPMRTSVSSINRLFPNLCR